MDKRGIYETELCGVGMWITLILFVVVDPFLDAWTWVWAITLIVVGLLGWFWVIQHGTARERARQRLKEAVRSKLLALSPEQRSDLNALARRGEICLTDDDAEDQIDAALRRCSPPCC
jgi:hypothetical protein